MSTLVFVFDTTCSRHNIFVFNSLFIQVVLLVLSLVSITVIVVQLRFLSFLRGYVGKTLYNSLRGCDDALG